MPVGAEVVPEGVRFRVWAPQRSRVQVICDGHPPLPLARDGEYFTGTCAAARARHALLRSGWTPTIATIRTRPPATSRRGRTGPPK